ncbi:leucine-rich repeat-containing protein 27 isoform X1 [Ictalurus furcatus]|uniref:leucine-rich repeat-containing protein 27 isoform X1 n=1 Tax=Ictalurus furcatus TaxID=66913 RepID=UPI0023506835|nr:leucine-rich repeat-containing protein 27 isoform X1 [Ictalurus furcatus]XP_053477636.1 leucine-rich repeat-containing protein 27 isoform X1 [Ictalurus furcatus]
MTALEEDPNDLHLSLDCGENAIKSPSRGSVCRGEDSAEHQMNHDSSDILYLSRQKLKVIPDCVCKYTPLKNLYLEGNELSSLPDNLFSSLPHLLWLDLRNNQLTCLPVDIGQHRCLKTLLLEGNPITELPVELGNMITLRALSLRNCPISFPPQEVLQQGLAHILQFLRRTAVAQRPLSVHSAHTASDMPAVEKLPLSKILQSSLDLSEVDDNEVQHFKELRQQMIQMDRADLGYITPVILPQHHLRAAEGDRSHRTHPPSINRAQELTRGMFPELPPSDVQNWKRSEERRLTAMREFKEKQALLEQKRKNEELLQEWRNQAKIMQERKILEHKQDRSERLWKEGNAAVSTNNPNDTGEALNDSHKEAHKTQQTSLRTHKETEEAREARDRELEQRIRTHVQMMQQRRRRPRGSPAEEAKAAAQEMEEVKQLQMELAERRRVKDLEYRLSAFTGESAYDK